MRMAVVMLMLGTQMLAVAMPIPAGAQSSDDLANMRREIDALKEGQRALQRDLEDIKGLLRARVAAPAAQAPQPTLAQPVAINIEGAPVLGNKNARVTVVEFSDYQCPFCARYSQQTFPTLVKEYIDAGKVKYVLRDFPIPQHPQAPKAHEAAHCAGEQGKYWDMHHRLFGDIRGQDPDKLTAHARALRLDVKKFEQCLASGRHEATVKKAVEEGQRVGVRGTPTFFVGVSGPGGTVQATRMLRGAQPYERFKELMDTALADAQQR
jgi:protein-disulfide isomerase